MPINQPIYGLNPVNGNNLINSAQSTSGINLTGRFVAPGLPGRPAPSFAGDVVTVTLNGKSYFSTVGSDGGWSLNLGASDLASLGDGQTYTITAVMTGPGVKITATQQVTVDRSATLSINPIDGNGVINAGNATQGITISGHSSDSIASNLVGQSVAVVLNGKTYNTTIQSGGGWSVKVSPADLAGLSNGQSYSVSASVTDKAGNVASATSGVLFDTAPPVLAIASQTDEATGPNGAVATFAATATDLVDGTDPVVFKEGTTVVHSGDTFAIGTHIITASTVDSAGNAASETFSVTVQDTTPPVLTPVANQRDEATGPNGAVATFAATAIDLVDGTDPVVFKEGNTVVHSGDTFAIGTNVITASATDAHGNTSSESFSITVQDTTPPMLTPVASQTDEATGPNGAVATFAATATDLVDGIDPVVFKEGTTIVHSGDTFALGTNLISASATDAHGNTSSEIFGITVQDTTPPVLTPVADQTVAATGPNGAVATFSATATDLVDGTDPVVFEEGTTIVHSGDTFAIGTNVIAASATDAHGNTSSESFSITVTNNTVSTPMLAINAIDGNDVLNAVEAQTALTIGGTSTGVVNQTVTVTLNGSQYTGQVAGDGTWSVSVPAAALATAVLPDNSYLVTADVTDQHGVAAPEASRTLTVHETLPTLAINAIDGNDVLNAVEAGQPLIITGISSGADSQTVTVALNGSQYTGQIANDGTWSATVPSTALGSATLPDASYKVTADVTDAFGNAATEASRSLAVHETLPLVPTFNLAAADQIGSSTSPETQSSHVTLVGQTGAGDTVTLQSSGQTTIASNTGVFTFSNVALVQGANPLTVQATDAFGNTSTSSISIQRDAPTTTVDPVLQWNQSTLAAIAQDADAPTVASRALAMESLAVYDAISAIDGTPGYLLNVSAPSDASTVAAVAEAADTVLDYLYPAQAATFDAQLQTELATIPDGQGKTDGIALGKLVAQDIIALRANDGFNADIIDTGSTTVGQWQPTAPGYGNAVTPQWANVTPFALTSSDQFLPPAPPALDSAAYSAAVNETQSLGAGNSTTRTAAETQSALFWNDQTGTYGPPGEWNAIADQIAQTQGNSMAQDAQLLAELNVAEADAAIAAWNTKYTYNAWRPIEAIQNANAIGNPGITQDPNWTPLITTPAFPEYVAGHAVFSTAAAQVLDSFFGSNTAFTATSPSLAGTTLSFSSFDQAAQAAGESRVYGGIHFQFSVDAGATVGQEVGDWTLAAFNQSKDTLPPRIVLDQTSGLVTNADPTITGFVTDNLSGVASLAVSIDGRTAMSVSFDANGKFSLPVSLPTDGSADGHHTLTFTAVDAAGNVTTPISFGFTLDTKAPQIALATNSIQDGGTLVAGAQLAGTVTDEAGVAITALGYAFDGGTTMPIAFDPSNGAFDATLNLSQLGTGSHTVTLSTTDKAGNTTTDTFAVSLPTLSLLTITSLTPARNADEIGVTYRPQVMFSRAVDATTLTSSTLYATDSSGAVVPGTVVPITNSTGNVDGAWLLFTDPLPGASTITLHVQGDAIKGNDGSLLDAAGTGTPGTDLTETFTTVSTAGVPNTSITGIVVDPGLDNTPMTADDFKSAPDGSLDFANDTWKLPIAGVKVYILGDEQDAVFTNAQGQFTLSNVPTGDVKLVFDGTTATNPPAGYYFPPMTMDLTVRAGIANTVMGSMGSLQQQSADAADPAVYLPRIANTVLLPISNTAPTTITMPQDASLGLTAQQTAEFALTVQPNSLIDANGKVVQDPQIGIAAVAPSLIDSMLPSGVPHLNFTFTIQAPTGAVFTTPLQLTVPNLDHLAAGTKTFLMSFDHTTGRLAIDGTGTVSADGATITTDPGSGIQFPGWHFFAPPPPPPPPPPPDDPPFAGPPDDGPSDGSYGGTDGGDPLYAALTSAKGVVQRFEFDSHNGFSYILGSNSKYTLSLYDPFNNTIGSEQFQTGFAGSITNIPAIALAPDPGTPLADGLSAAAAAILGVNPTQSSNLIPGITDAAVLEAGLFGSRSLASTTGVIANLPLLGEAFAVKLAGAFQNPLQQLAYIATGPYGLAIVDTEVPKAPIVFSQLALLGIATDVAIDNTLGIAAVATGLGGLQFVDIEDPHHPMRLGTTDIAASAVVVSQGIAYANDGGALDAVDMATGAVLQSIQGTSSVTGIALDGTMLYTMDSSNNLRVSDISSGHMVLDSALTLPFGGQKLTVGDGIAYVAAGNALQGIGGYMTVDVSNPLSPHLIEGPDNQLIAGGDIALNGSGLGLTVQLISNGVDVIDTSNPAQTGQFVIRYPLPQKPFGVAIASGIGYVADGFGGLQVVSYESYDTKGVPPQIQITNAPPSQVVEGSTLQIGAKITDDVQVRNVELLFNGIPVLNSLSYPFDLTATLPSIAANGSNTVDVQISATDTGGNTSVSAPMAIQLLPDPIAPQLTSENVAEHGIEPQSFRSLTFEFSKPIDPKSATAANFTLTGPGGTPVTPVSIQTRNNLVQVTYAALPLGSYQSVVSGVVTDTAGLSIGNPVTTDFSVEQLPIQWLSGLGGNWDDPINWSTGTVPGPTDTAVIARAGSYVVSVLNSIAVAAFTISNSSADVQINDPNHIASIGAVTNSGDFEVQNGSVLMVGGNLTNTGSTFVSSAGAGGSSLSTGGTLTNSGFIQIGNNNVVGTLTAQGLSNTGRIDIDGASSNQSLLNIAAAAPSTWTGTLNVSGDGLLEFGGSSEITAIAANSSINLFGPQALVADAGLGLTSDTALTSLASIAGQLLLQNGATLTTTVGLTNSNDIFVDNGGNGGSSLSVGGTLTNGGGFIQIGNNNVVGTLTAQGLSNTGRIDIDGASSNQSLLNIAAAAPSTWTGTLNVSGDGLLEFGGSSEITAIAANSSINLFGPQALVADAGLGLTSDTALTSLASIAGQLLLQNGATLTTTVGLTNSNDIFVDNGGNGGSSLSVGGTLTNGGGFIQIGNNNVVGTLTAQGLSNTGRIDIDGASSNQSLLNIAAAAPSTWTGTLNVSGDGLLEFGGSSEITAIAANSSINLFGPQALVADAGLGLTSDTALTSLASIAGQLLLQNGATLTTTVGLTNSNDIFVDNGGNGGSSLSVGGTLTNGGGFIQIGNNNVVGTLTAQGLSNTGRIDIDGASSNQSLLNIAAAAPSTWTGTLNVSGDGLLEFGGSSEITAIAANSSINLFGPQALVADAGLGLTSDTALTSLASIAGQLLLQNGATLTTTVGLTNSNDIFVDNGGNGGSSLSVGGTLTNGGGFIQIGNNNVVGTLTAQGLSNTGRIDIDGASSNQSLLNIAAAAPSTWTGTLNVSGDGLLEFGGSSEITAIAANSSINLFGPQALVADAGLGLTSDTALTSLASIAGQLLLQNGATLTTTVGLTNSNDIFVDNGGNGGSSLSVGGTLTNGGGFIQIGNNNVVGTLTAQGLSNTGRIDIDGASSNQSLLNIAAAAPSTWTGTLNVSGDGLLEFGGSSEITAIAANSSINLFGPQALVADAGLGLTSDTALTSLASIAGQLLLQNGATLTTTVGLTNSNDIFVDNGGNGGSSLSVGGTLTNSGFVQVGDGFTTTTLSTDGLINNGTVNLATGSATHPVQLLVAGNVTNSSTVNIGSVSEVQLSSGDSYSQTAGTTTVTGTLAASSVNVSGGLIDFVGAVTGTNVTGQINVSSNATVDFRGQSSPNVNFTGGSTGTLLLFDSQDFSGSVAGLTTVNRLDLRDINFSTIQTPIFNGNSSGGVLTVSDGTHTAHINLTGDYTASTFTPTSDGNNGTFIIDPTIKSSEPTAVIADGQKLEVCVPSAQNVTFRGNTGDLKLEASTTFAGMVAGFGAQDAIDLADIDFGPQSTLSYAQSADKSGGTLMVNDGTHRASLTLLGQYAAAGFGITSDHSRGTIITNTAAQGGSIDTNLLTTPHA